MVWGMNPYGSEIFRTCTMSTGVSSLGVEWLSHDINHLPPSRAKVKDSV